MSRLSPLAALSIIAVSASSLAAQQPFAALTSAAKTTLTRAAAARAREHAVTVIQGNALTATNGQVTNAVVRLRDARFGGIVGTQVTDKSGLFAFKAVDPGSYIVELMANDHTVMAASQLLNVNSGEAVSAVLKLPYRIPVFAGMVGSTSTPSATAVVTEAAASSIVAVVPTAPVSPGG